MNQVKTSAFKHYAMRYVNKMQDEKELRAEDWTDRFYNEIYNMLKQEEIVIIQIHGKPRMGKSTVALMLGKQILDMMVQLKQTTEKFGMYHIARNQYELSKKHRDPERNWTVIVSDEINTLEDSGQNVTMEIALRKQFSDVQAGRYIHKVLVSPKETLDQNTDIILEVVQPDKEQGVTHCLLWYKLFYGGNTFNMLLGHVNIDVSPILQNWNASKRIFFKKNKTKAESALIAVLCKKDFYVEYMLKKYEKMDLLNRYNILIERELDYAEPILEVVDKLKPLVKAGASYRNLVKQYLKRAYWSRGMPLTILGSTLEESNIIGILDLYKGLYNIENAITTLHRRYENKKISPILYKERHQELKSVRLHLIESLKDILNHYNTLIDIKKKYNKMLGDSNGR